MTAPLQLAVVAADLSQRGGAEAVAVWTALGLARRGHAVALYTAAFRPELWPELAEAEALVRLVPAVPQAGHLQRARNLARELRHELDRWPLVYAHGDLALWWTAHTRAPVVWLCHEPPRRLYAPVTDAWLERARHRDGADRDHPALAALQAQSTAPLRDPRRALRRWRERRHDRRCARRARHVFVNSSCSAQAFARVYRRSPEVLDLGVPAPAPHPACAERRGLAVISGGNPNKNLHGVLAAAAELARRRALPDLTWHVWGPGTDAPPFRARLADRGLQERVLLHGFLSNPEADVRLRGSRALLYLPLCEPFGLATVEALLRDTPVVASDHGGPAEVLARCGGGILVDPLRPERVAEALQRTLGDPARESALRSAARQASGNARRLFDPELYLQRTEARLRALLGRCAPAQLSSPA